MIPAIIAAVTQIIVALIQSSRNGVKHTKNVAHKAKDRIKRMVRRQA